MQVFQTAGGGAQEAGACLATFAQVKHDQKDGVSVLLLSPDGSRLYSGASDGTVAAWRIAWQAAPAAAGGGGSAGGFRRGFL